MAGEPIKLGSAAGSRLIFQTGSRITTSDSGIQSCSVQALCPDGANVFSFLPAAGANFNNVFGNSYLPADFKVDITGGGYDIEYLQGKAAKVTINFKRQDPNAPGGGGRAAAKISVDSAINYKTVFGASFSMAASGDQSGESTIGFPEPIVTVKYNADTPPVIGGGSLSSLYALPDSAKAAGFPTLAEIVIPLKIVVGTGTSGGYYNGSTIVSFGPLTAPQLFQFTISFIPNPLGWQLTKLKWDPVSGESFYDVEENWRGFYTVGATKFISQGPV
jgi:hypothetical protein